jgi:hypothetical protein
VKGRVALKTILKQTTYNRERHFHIQDNLRSGSQRKLQYNNNKGKIDENSSRAKA